MKGCGMNKREQAIFSILKASVALFHDNGYQGTSVRQIAETAGVSLGMVNHYFGSKECLGSQVLSLLDTHANAALPSKLSFPDDPILFDLVAVRLLYTFLSAHGYWDFYVDSLRFDFFFNNLTNRPSILIDELSKTYSFEASADAILLYSRFLPYMMEKTVVIKKAEGLFPSISYEEVPYLVCQTAMSHFIPEADVKARDADSKAIAARIGAGLTPAPSDDLIKDFACRFDESMQHKTPETHWMNQVAQQLQTP